MTLEEQIAASAKVAEQVAVKAAEYKAMDGKQFTAQDGRVYTIKYVGVVAHPPYEAPKQQHTFEITTSDHKRLIGCADFLASHKPVEAQPNQ